MQQNKITCIKWVGGQLCGRECRNGTEKCDAHVSISPTYSYRFPGEDTPTILPPAMAAE